MNCDDAFIGVVMACLNRIAYLGPIGRRTEVKQRVFDKLCLHVEHVSPMYAKGTLVYIRERMWQEANLQGLEFNYLVAIPGVG